MSFLVLLSLLSCLFSCAGCFFVADEILATNGILAVVTLGMAMACLGHHATAAYLDSPGAATQAAMQEHVNMIW